MNIFEKAKEGIMTPEVEAVARQEGIPAAEVLKGLAEGTIVIFKNSNYNLSF